MPEVEDTVRPAGQEPRAEDHVGLVVEDRRQQVAELVGVVLEVGVLHDDVVGRGVGEAGAQRGTLALVAVVQHHPHRRVVDAGEDLAVSSVEPSSTTMISRTHGESATCLSSVRMVPCSL